MKLLIMNSSSKLEKMDIKPKAMIEILQSFDKDLKEYVIEFSRK